MLEYYWIIDSIKLQLKYKNMKDFNEFLKDHDDKKIAHFKSHINNSSIGDIENQ